MLLISMKGKDCFVASYALKEDLIQVQYIHFRDAHCRLCPPKQSLSVIVSLTEIMPVRRPTDVIFLTLAHIMKIEPFCHFATFHAKAVTQMSWCQHLNRGCVFIDPFVRRSKFKNRKVFKRNVYLVQYRCQPLGKVKEGKIKGCRLQSRGALDTRGDPGWDLAAMARDLDIEVTSCVCGVRKVTCVE